MQTQTEDSLLENLRNEDRGFDYCLQNFEDLGSWVNLAKKKKQLKKSSISVLPLIVFPCSKKSAHILPKKKKILQKLTSVKKLKLPEKPSAERNLVKNLFLEIDQTPQTVKFRYQGHSKQKSFKVRGTRNTETMPFSSDFLKPSKKKFNEKKKRNSSSQIEYPFDLYVKYLFKTDPSQELKKSAKIDLNVFLGEKLEKTENEALAEKSFKNLVNELNLRRKVILSTSLQKNSEGLK